MLRNILYIGFILVAAPLQYHMDAVAPWLRGTVVGTTLTTAYAAALVSGTLFFYSITLCVETLFRLEADKDLASDSWAMPFKGTCWILLLVVFVIFSATGYPPLTPGTMKKAPQVWCAVLSCLVAAIAHGRVEVVRSSNGNTSGVTAKGGAASA